MATYKVREGQQLAHVGTVLEAGATVELARGLAYEVRHLVDEVDADGQVVTAPVPAWYAALGSHPDREQAVALRDARQQAADRLQAVALELDARSQALDEARASLLTARADLADIDQAIEEALTAPPPVCQPMAIPIRVVPAADEPAPGPEPADTTVRPPDDPSHEKE